MLFTLNIHTAKNILNEWYCWTKFLCMIKALETTTSVFVTFIYSICFSFVTWELYEGIIDGFCRLLSELNRIRFIAHGIWQLFRGKHFQSSSDIYAVSFSGVGGVFYLKKGGKKSWNPTKFQSCRWWVMFVYQNNMNKHSLHRIMENTCFGRRNSRHGTDRMKENVFCFGFVLFFHFTNILISCNFALK